MPDSYGKRQREAVKARKAAAREERRIARRQRRDGEGVEPEGDEFGAAEPPEELVRIGESADSGAAGSSPVVEVEDRATSSEGTGKEGQ